MSRKDQITAVGEALCSPKDSIEALFLLFFGFESHTSVMDSWKEMFWAHPIWSCVVSIF